MRICTFVLEVLTHEPDARADALANRHARHEDDELREVVPDSQIEDRPQVDVGLTRAGLHLDIEIERVARKRWCNLKPVAILHALQVREDQVAVKHEAVTDRSDLLREVNIERRLIGLRQHRCAPQRRDQLLCILRLPVEQVDHGRDRIQLIRLAGVELKS